MRNQGVVFIYDHFQPINQLEVPLHDQFCFIEEVTCRVVRGQKLSGVLKNLRERSEPIRKYRQWFSRTRAYVIFANQIESLDKETYEKYLHLYYDELYELGLDPCFVHITPEGYGETCEEVDVIEHHKKVSSAFIQVAKEYDTFNVYLTKNNLCGTQWQSGWKDSCVSGIVADLVQDFRAWRNYD